MATEIQTEIKRWLYAPPIILVLGAMLGVLATWLDRYTQNLGNLFSQFGIWVLLGVILVRYAPSCRLACLDCFLGCIGMVICYYGMIWLHDGRIFRDYAIGWGLFSFFSPFLAFLTWQARNNGVLPILLRIGIILFAWCSSVWLFEGPRWYDFMICVLLIYMLFISPKQPKHS